MNLKHSKAISWLGLFEVNFIQPRGIEHYVEKSVGYAEITLQILGLFKGILIFIPQTLPFVLRALRSVFQHSLRSC